MTITAANIDSTKISSSVRVLKNNRVEWHLSYDAAALGLGVVIIHGGVVDGLAEAMDAADGARNDLNRIADRVRFHAYAVNEAANFARRERPRNRSGL